MKVKKTYTLKDCLVIFLIDTLSCFCIHSVFNRIKKTISNKVMKINAKKIEDLKIPIALYKINSFSTPKPIFSEKKIIVIRMKSVIKV